MTKKTVFGVAAVALAALVMAPSASAACGGIRTASTYNSGTGQFTYWHSPSGDATGTIVGQTWQLGAPATWSTGNCTNFLYFGAGGIGLNLDLGSCGNGCPSLPPAPLPTLVILAQKQDPTGVTDFLLATVLETPGGSVNFDYSTQGAHVMIPIPQPTVLSSSKAGSIVTLHVSLPSIAAGLFGPNAASAVSGYNVVSALSVNDPGRDAALYQPRATALSPGGTGASDTTVPIDCGPATAGQDAWVATQLQFENGTVLAGAVGKARRVHCLGALADPKEWKIVPKKNTKGELVIH